LINIGHAGGADSACDACTFCAINGRRTPPCPSARSERRSPPSAAQPDQRRALAAPLPSPCETTRFTGRFTAMRTAIRTASAGARQASRPLRQCVPPPGRRFRGTTTPSPSRVHRQRKNGQSGGPQHNPPAAYRESPAFSRPPLRLAPGRGTTPPTAERLRSWRRCSDDNTLAVMKRWAARSAPDGARAPRPIPAAPHPLPTPHPALGTRTAPCYRPERRTERDDAPAPTRRTRP